MKKLLIGAFIIELALDIFTIPLAGNYEEALLDLPRPMVKTISVEPIRVNPIEIEEIQIEHIETEQIITEETELEGLEAEVVYWENADIQTW